MGHAAAAGLSLAGLAGCAGISHRTSYIDDLVEPGKRSTVFQWTDLMLQAVRDLSLTPVQASRGFAMAHAAGSIAVGNRLAGTRLVAPEQYDLDTAYAVAFSVALEEAWTTSLLFSRRRFLATRAGFRHQDASVVWGHRAAQHIIDMRVNDGAELSRSEYYVSRDEHDTLASRAMRWTPTGPLYGARSGPAFDRFQRGASPAWGWQRPWIVANTGDYQPEPFPDYRSPEFAAQFEKIRALGRDDGSTRTRGQSEIALFWEDGPRGISNPGHFQLIAIDIAQRQDWSLAQQASFFATLSLAQADAAIIAWRSKYQFDILRPETAIRFARARFAGENSLVADPGWQSYIPTPGFPSYVSGHSVFGAASMTAIALMLGSDNITVTSSVPDRVNWPAQLTGVTRRWSSLREIAEENGASREYGGVHWEADNLQGLAMGYRLASEVVNAMRPEVAS